MKPVYLARDNLDDRREVHQLLERLPPAKRVAWLQWCCRQCYLPNSRIHPRVSRRRTKGTALEVFLDAWALFVQYDLSPDRALDKLVELVRAQGPCRRFLG